ncbi:class II fructose-bisphosphate aldolase family protein [Candidatus Uhrbacteria bacterium]|nr:class II fructose-bisphosphate aldolase family protein [Candidatus Uhrbacteria bacterium]
MLVTMKSLLMRAQKGGYAVGAFNIDNLEGLQAVMQAAEETKSPVIIATSESTIQYAGLESIKALVHIAAEEHSKISLALHLDHGKDLSLIKRCIDHGWTSVMFDGSLLPYEENVKKTQTVVSWAQAKGVTVEAELGALKTEEDARGAEREVLFTDPKQAVDFVKKTGIDALAISIGTSHGPFKFEGKTVLDYKRLKEIKRLTRMPLVLHGASGIPAKIVSIIHEKCENMNDCKRLSSAHGVSSSAIKKAIACGINKVNIGTDLRLAFTAGVRKALIDHGEEYDEREFLKEARALVKQVAQEKMLLFKNKK